MQQLATLPLSNTDLPGDSDIYIGRERAANTWLSIGPRNGNIDTSNSANNRAHLEFRPGGLKRGCQIETERAQNADATADDAALMKFFAGGVRWNKSPSHADDLCRKSWVDSQISSVRSDIPTSYGGSYSATLVSSDFNLSGNNTIWKSNTFTLPSAGTWLLQAHVIHSNASGGTGNDIGYGFNDSLNFYIAPTSTNGHYESVAFFEFVTGLTNCVSIRWNSSGNTVKIQRVYIRAAKVAGAL